MYSNDDQIILFYEDFQYYEKNFGHNTFNLSLFKREIQTAFESYDAKLFRDTLDTIITLFRGNPTRYLQAIDASCNLLYLSISLLPNGQNELDNIFKEYPDGYHSIYKQTQTDQVINWLETFRDGLVNLLKTQHINFKNNMIYKVKSYIDSNIEKKLTLNDVADLFGISANYLSLLFKKTMDIGFSEYVTQKKISIAKTWISEGNLKVYEIADRLGFESAFYFSKVFKKVVGCSPSAFLQGK